MRYFVYYRIKYVKNQEESFMINKLVEKIKKTNAPIVVGLDPMLWSLTVEYKKKCSQALWCLLFLCQIFCFIL